jgi:hypothetical protein
VGIASTELQQLPTAPAIPTMSTSTSARATRATTPMMLHTPGGDFLNRKMYQRKETHFVMKVLL